MTDPNHKNIQEMTDNYPDEKSHDSSERLKGHSSELNALFDIIPDLLCIADTNGYFKYLNPEWENALGYSLEELLSRPFHDFIHPDDLEPTLKEIERQMQGRHTLNFINRYRCRDGSYKFLEWRAIPVKGNILYAVARDITERKLQEDERDLTARLISRMNSVTDFRELIRKLVTSLQSWSGCEAVGLRLRDGDDYPYFETRGFPPEFVESEKYLCDYDSEGEILRDTTGSPVLACMCGNVLRGRFDPEKPFFSKEGSFWTNSTTALLASTTEADRQARTRNRCNGEGYESVALIPLRAGGRVFGLMQFNDSRPDRFNKDLIIRFERMAENLAMGLAQRQATETLRVSEERFRRLFQLHSAVKLVINPVTGAIVDANEAAAQFYGWSVAELKTMFVQQLNTLPPDTVMGEIQKTLITEPYKTEYKHRRKDGSVRDVEVFNNLIEISGENLLYEIVHDITDRKKAENALRKSENRLRTLVRTIPDLIWVKDAEGVYLDCNEKFERFFGAGKKDIVGKTDYDFVDKELADFFRKHDRIAMETGMPCSNEEWITFAVDGHTALVDTIKTPMVDAEGNLLGILGIARDITSLKRAEQDYKRLFNEMLDGFAHHEIICDESGTPTDYRFIAVNPAFERMTGLESRTVVGKTVLEVMPETEKKWIETYGKVALTGEATHFTYYSPEIKKHFEVTAFQPAPKQFACIFTDITERLQSEEEKNKLEDRLMQAQKMEAIGALAGGIAHDLNNILFPITGLAEMLLDEIPPENRIQESLEQIYKSALRGSDLVKQILAFSRQSNPKKLPIRIQPVMKEVLKLVRAAIPMNIEITSRIETDCGMVSADPVQVHQILMNLITNAYHAVEENGGTIHVGLEAVEIETDPFAVREMPTGRCACIVVSDTGTGMDSALIDKIFTPYFTTKGLGKGTGLGLSVVHGIVKEHGGDIRVSSEVGKGTVFRVFLPLLEDDSEKKVKALSRQYPTGTEKILLVDDEAPIVRLEQMMLERLGYRVTIQTDSLDALEVFKADPDGFDLVISDRGMPNRTGEQLARELISIRPGIPIILCTGFSDENDEHRARAAGIKGFLKKPVAMEDLAQSVRKVLDESKNPNRAGGSTSSAIHKEAL